ncbi:hypothetical protein [Komagataeibacter diospyri]|uniref:Uncharacterized protein n=1 Tax=Komagataeibacter diospyri TaxID=1932662 RepID=A0A4P5NL92_9PROT|nr:hypothetical protein [Komagataeibacter diospyri]GCE82490.1 hypothetical protein MSKU9_0631 [Komagataeibacter diospyri]
MDVYKGWTEADLPDWLATPRQDFDRLAVHLRPEVERLLARQGVFAPFGAVMVPGRYLGTIETVAGPGGQADSTIQLDRARDAVQDAARQACARAAAVVANCTVLLPGGDGPEQAAVIMCTHRDGTAENIVYPYRLGEAGVTFAPVQMTEGTQDIFPPIRLRFYIRETCPPRPAGYVVTAFAFHGINRVTVCARMGLTDTSTPQDDTRPAPTAIGSLPDGWTVVLCNDPAMARAHAARLATYSAGATVVTCMVDERRYESVTCFHHDGTQIWSVIHHGQGAGPHDLTITGTPPALLHETIAAMDREETESGYPPGMLDFYFDIPVEVMFALTGFRYCQRDYADVVFDVAREIPGGLV